MLRSTHDPDIEQKPRKRVKLDLSSREQYNEFKGQAIEVEQPSQGHGHNGEGIAGEDINVGDEIVTYGKIFQDIKKNPRGLRKLDVGNGNLPHGAKEETKKTTESSVKKQQNPPIKKQQKPTTPSSTIAIKKQKPKQISANWKQFLQQTNNQQSNNNNSNNNNNKSIPKSKDNKNKHNYQFVAIDCQFVKSGDEECLARVSLVNEHGEEIYDSYVRPTKKITDFVTEVSGITYSHIKNAPNEDHVIPEIKRKMLNKIVIGHTVDKDLSVCGLKEWTGFKKVIDIADAHAYSPGGKRLALKRLAFNHLGKVIQEGWHSSVEDAQATMQLFLKNKQEILKEKKIVKA